MPDSRKPELSREQIAEATRRGLKKYEGRNLLEQYALFMGTAQLLELALKQLAHRLFGVDLGAIERHTMGQVARLLRDNGLRPDFLGLLDEFVKSRNHIAHELLANQALLAAWGAGGARFETKVFERGAYELEQICVLLNWSKENERW